MSKIEVNRQMYVVMCIQLLKAPEGIVDSMTKEFAEEEMLRLSND